MRVLYDRVAAIGVHKDMIKVAVRVPGKKRGTRKTDVLEYRTFYGVLQAMARELRGRGVTHVESPGTLHSAANSPRPGPGRGSHSPIITGPGSPAGSQPVQQEIRTAATLNFFGTESGVRRWTVAAVRRTR